MKKSLLAILLLVSPLLANPPFDTSTTGNQKFLKPSLTQVDPNRNWGDKYNGNWDIADASMTVIQNQITALSTTTANPQVANISIYDEGTSLGNATTLNFVGAGITPTQSGSTTTITVTATGGAATVQGATMSYVFDISSVYVATNGPCAIPKACYSMGVDSGVMVAYWMDAVLPSTVTFTGFQVKTTTGASAGVVFQGITMQDRFNNTTISLATGTSTGRGDGFSGFVSTAIPFNAGETFSIWCTTVSNSGINSRGVKFHYDMWFKSRY